MASSGQYTGEALLFVFGSTTVSGNYTKVDWKEDVDIKDATGGADTNKIKLARVKDGNCSITAWHKGGSAGSVLWTALIPGTGGTITFAPQGTSSANLMKHTVAAIVKERSLSHGAEDVSEIKVSFEFNGAVTDSLTS